MPSLTGRGGQGDPAGKAADAADKLADVPDKLAADAADSRISSSIRMAMPRPAMLLHSS